MKKKLKIGFADFVSRWDPVNNYFYNLLSKYYDLEISNEPEILFCTSYGHDRYKYRCLKIFYTGENERPDLKEMDFAMSFDYLDDKRHLRLPLYTLYIEMAEGERRKGKKFNDLNVDETIMEALCRGRTREEALKAWHAKKGFCCFINSNPHAELRIRLFKKLSEYKKVDSGGKVMNTLGYTVKDKIDFIRNYRFVFAMENSSADGYTTEKIVEPFFTDSIPLYWGNKLVHKDFNPLTFVNYHEFENDERFIEKVIEIDQNEDLAVNMLMQPKFAGGVPNEYADEVNVKNFLLDIIENRHKIVPVSGTFKGRMNDIGKIFSSKKSAFKLKVLAMIGYN